jgi:hypothetical protein
VRHVIGVILAVAMAAAVFFGAAWGYLRLLRLPAPAGSLSGLPANGGSLLSDHGVLLSFGALLGTGLLAGILVAAPRISPLAAGLPGLALIGWSVFYVVRVHRAVELIPLRDRAFGTGFEAMGINGVLAAVGIAMVIPLFIPSRWRRRPAGPGQQEYTAPAQPGTTGLLSSDWAETAPQPQVNEGNDYGFR